MTIELTNPTRAVAIVDISDQHREYCREQGIRFEFDYGAMLDSLYPALKEEYPQERAKILGYVYKLLNKYA
jgi:hypothetical protein